MDSKRVMFALFVIGTVMLSTSHQVSARRLLKDKTLEGASDEVWDASGHSGSYKSTEYQNLEEIDRLKLSINKLICRSMEEGCGHMDDAEDQSDATDHSESFANLNPCEFVQEY